MQVNCAVLCKEDYYELSVTCFPRYLQCVFTQEDMNISGVIIVPKDYVIFDIYQYLLHSQVYIKDFALIYSA